MIHSKTISRITCIYLACVSIHTMVFGQGIGISTVGDGVELQLKTPSDSPYVLETQAQLMSGELWKPLMEFRGSAGGARSFVDPYCADKESKFYRLRQLLSKPPVEVSNFRLISQTGQAHELYYHWPAKAIVLFLTGTDIQNAVESAAELNRIRESYPSGDVITLVLSLSSHGEREEIAALVEGFPLELPVLQDTSHAVTRTLSSGFTPEALVVDPLTWSIQYRGPVQLTINQGTTEITLSPLSDAVADLLAQRPVSISRMVLPDTTLQVNPVKSGEYASDIAPILINNCFPCHTPGNIAPWAMTEYSVIAEYARLIKSAVLAGEMPPWHADPKYAHFSNSKSMTGDEISTLIDWIDRGTPRGGGDDPLAEFDHVPAGEWTLGTPDGIVSIPVQSIPATGSVDYKYLTASNPFGRDVWLKGVAVEPGNRSVVHHCLVFKGTFFEFLAIQGGLSGFFAGYVPGMEQTFFPEGTGKLLRKNDMIVFQMHYTVSGTATTDKTRLGFYLADEVPQRELLTESAYDTSFTIPAQVNSHPVVATKKFNRDSVIYEFSPHMHYRGASARYTLIYPNGSEEVVLNVPAYFFDWQALYRLSEPIEVPAGTILLCEGTFDNSRQNSYNPDPTSVVKFGEQSWEEMFIGYINYAEK